MNMKRTLLILALMFFVFDYCSAKKKDADKILLDGNHANSFLVHKRRGWPEWCEYAQEYAEDINESRWGGLAPTVNINEECCVEGCDAEEVNENILPSGYSDLVRAERNREWVDYRCC
ncbi:uncharacterized protein LOC144656594 [Oculina patagonica]